MKHYLFDKVNGVLDEDGAQVLQIVKNHCSEKFRVIAGRELAEKLNAIERAKGRVRKCELMG